MELTGLCGQRFRLTLELDQGYSRPPGEEPNRPVLIEPIMPTEQRGQPSEIRSSVRSIRAERHRALS
jgi:hypothetical protein